MSDLLLILLGAAPDQPVRWGEFAQGALVEGGRLDGAGALSELSARAETARRVVALLPGEQVAARAFPSAPRSSAKLRAAASYMMEDELAEPAAMLTIGVCAERAVPVAFAVKTAILDAWREAFAAASIDPDVLSADYLVLPSDSERAMIIADGRRIIAAFRGVGASLEEDMFAELAPQLFADGSLRASVAGDARLCKMLPDGADADWLGEIDDARLLSIFADAALAASPPNFLRTRMFNRKALAAAFAPWRRAALLAACLVGVLFIGAVAGGVRDAREAARWRDAATALHREFFPDYAAADPATFARRRLAEETGARSFLWLTSRFAAALENNESVAINRIRFNAARGEFIVSIESATDAAIEQFKSALAASGVAAEDMGGYRSAGGVWTGELIARAQ